MNFYSQLSKYYKYIFPTDSTILEFIKRNMPINQKIVDIACGDGEYTISLFKEGFDIIGVDLELKMIAAAQTKANTQNLDIHFKQANMLHLNKVFQPDEFSGAFCIGNSLVHLDSIQQIKNALENIKDILTKNSKLIIQIINYDRILKHNITSLPTITKSVTTDVNRITEIEFVRKYESFHDKILFSTTLKTPQDGIFNNSVVLLPLTSSQLVSMLTNLGYRNIKLFGSFTGNDFNEDESFALIVVCAL